MERRLSSVSLYEPSEDEEIEQFIEEYRRSQQASREAGYGLYQFSHFLDLPGYSDAGDRIIMLTFQSCHQHMMTTVINIDVAD